MPYFAIGMLDMVVAVLMGAFVFHVPLRGSVVLLFAMASCSWWACSRWACSSASSPRASCWPARWPMVLTFLPAFLLSGFMFPIANMPRPIQMITYLVPARYFVALLQGIYLKGVGVSGNWASTIVLLSVFGARDGCCWRPEVQKKLTVAMGCAIHLPSSYTTAEG